MIINLQRHLEVGETVKMYKYDHKKEEYKYESDALLLEEVKNRYRSTFIYKGSVYCYKWFKVKYEDGFTTIRKVYYLVSDTTTKIPEDHMDLYTYNLEHPVSDIEEDLIY